jgi:hypothetical protein
MMATWSARAGSARTSLLTVHLSFATLLAKAQRKEGSFGTMTLSPIAKKLRALIGEKEPEGP